jgi:predicted phosphodiesterase
MAKVKPFSKYKVAAQYASQHKSASTMAIARILLAREPLIFSSVDQARDAVRATRGEHRTRIAAENRTTRQPAPKLPPLPQPKSEFDGGWDSVAIDGARRVLRLSDIHVPYHDVDALKAALAMGSKHRCDTIILDGDIADCYSVSHWQTDPRQRDFAGEVKTARELFAAIRARFPKARIVWKLGNHEERLERYFMQKAPELLGLDCCEFAAIYQTNAYGVEIVRDMRPLTLGKLYLLHGHEYRFPIANPVNPARGLFLRAKTHAICGHFHQSSQHSERNLEQNVVSTWSTGCLSDLHPAYRPLNNWNHGFAIVQTDKDGSFAVENYRIFGGECYR